LQIRSNTNFKFDYRNKIVIIVPISTIITMRGRSKIFDEKEVIQKARDIFWSKGFEASSTEELLAAMGIGKGSFYHSFEGGKKQLFEKVLDQLSNEGIRQLKEKLSKSKKPIDVIRAFFRSIASDNKKNHLLGCFLGNTVAELSNIDHGLTVKAITLLKRLEQVFFEVIKNAQESGELKSKEDPNVIANYLITTWNGLSITRRMYPEVKILKPLIELQLKLIE